MEPSPNRHKTLLASVKSEPSDDAAAAADAAASPPTAKKPRQAEMVRVPTLSPASSLYFRGLVRRTRIAYDSLRAHLAARHRRPDMAALTLFKDRGLLLHRDKRIIGPLPGLAVGDVFFFRSDLCVVGLHRQVHAAIDTVAASQSESGEPIATSIVHDSDDTGDTLIYTGQTGKSRTAGRLPRNQRLDRGSIPLERSYTYGIEIRVVRGFASDGSPSGHVYVYDGIYKIARYCLDTGFYKATLVRVEGQEATGSSVMKFAAELRVDPEEIRPEGKFSADISLGKENFPVSVYNEVDGSADPLLLHYVDHPVYPDEILEGERGGSGCLCLAHCSTDCYCVKRNGGEIPYGSGGVLLRGKPLVYECGPWCKCFLSCPNRVTEKGIRQPLEVFRSKAGWGLRSLDIIQAGAFVCEISGIVLTEQESEMRLMKGDGVIRPHRIPARWTEWGNISAVYPDYRPPTFPLLPQLRFGIDVSKARNVGGYLRHSNMPNVFVQFVLFDHYDMSYPHLMVFAMENIPPLRELTLDYGQVEELTRRQEVSK